MPNIKSAKKRLLQSEKRRLRNRTRLVATRNMIKRLQRTTDKAEAETLRRKVASMLDKLAQRNIIHKNNAANKKSALDKLVNSLGQ